MVSPARGSTVPPLILGILTLTVTQKSCAAGVPASERAFELQFSFSLCETGANRPELTAYRAQRTVLSELVDLKLLVRQLVRDLSQAEHGMHCECQWRVCASRAESSGQKGQ